MVVLQKADTNLDEVVNDVNNLVNCIHCHGPFFFSFSFFCMCVCAGLPLTHKCASLPY